MADKDMFFDYNESQAHAGYRSAILYRKSGDTNYRFLIASETVPFMSGSRETFEFNLMNSRSIGQVEGKETTEQKEVEVLYTRDNAILLYSLKDQVLDFMSVTPQLIGYKCRGTISFTPNDAGNDIHRGTYTITPMSIDTEPEYMARDKMMKPLFFDGVIPDEVSIASLGTEATGVKINVAIKGYENAVYKYDTFSSTTNKPTGVKQDVSATNGIIELPKTKGLYIIYAEPQTSDVQTHSGTFVTVYITD